MQKYQKTLLLTLCFFYFSPLLVISKSLHLSSAFFTFLAFWCLLGFSTLVYLWRLFEKKTKKKLLESLYKETGYQEKKDYEEKVDRLVERMRLLVGELNIKNESEKTLLKKVEQLKEMCEHQESEYQYLNQDLNAQLEKREKALTECQLTIKEQRRIIEKKQEEINVLNMHQNDLKYEMENLLKIKKEETTLFNDDDQADELSNYESNHKPPPYELSLSEKLQHYIDLAREMTQSNPFTKPRKGYRFPLGTLVIDQRRLFDRLQNEESEVILVYSMDEQRLIFVNDHIKDLLGWNPDKFIKDFPFLVQKGLHQWHEAIDELKEGDQSEVRLLMKTFQGQNILTHCYLKIVPQGAFEKHILGILSSAAKR